MYQHILSNIGILGYGGICCYLLAEKEEKGRGKKRKKKLFLVDAADINMNIVRTRAQAA